MNSKLALFAVAFAIVFVLFAGCAQAPEEAGNNQTNSTQQALTAEWGDLVYVDYILEVNTTNESDNSTHEKVYDTSIESVARSAGIYQDGRDYSPLGVRLSSTSPYLPAFTRALNLMKEGENKTFTLPPEEGYGAYDESRIIAIKRFYNTSIYEQIPLAYFNVNDQSVEEGSIIESQFAMMMVVNATNSTVTVRYLPEINHTFNYNGLDQRVVSFDNETIYMEILAEPGASYMVTLSSGRTTSAVAKSVNETDILLDSNNPLAGKSLKFTVFVRQVVKV